MDELLEFLSPPVHRGVSRTPGFIQGVVETKGYTYDSLTYRRTYPKRATNIRRRQLRPNTLITSRTLERQIYSQKRPSVDVAVTQKSDCLDLIKNKTRRSKKIQTSSSNLENSIDKNNRYVVVGRKQKEKIYQISASSSAILKKKTEPHDNENRENLKLLIGSLDMDKSRYIKEHQLRFNESDTSLINEVYFEDNKPKYAEKIDLKQTFESVRTCCECERRKNIEKKNLRNLEESLGPIRLHLPHNSKSRLDSFTLNSPKNHLQIHGRIGLDQNDQYVLKCAATLDDKPIKTNCDDKDFVFPNVPIFNQNRVVSNNWQSHKDVPSQVTCPAYEECRKRVENRGIQVDSKHFSIVQDESTQYSTMNFNIERESERTTDDNNSKKNPLVVISVYHNKNAVVQESVFNDNLEESMTSKSIKQNKGKVAARSGARSKSPAAKISNKTSSKSIKNNSSKSSRSASPAPKRKVGNQINNKSSTAKSRSTSPNQRNTQSPRKPSNDSTSNSNNCCTTCDYPCKDQKSKGVISKTNLEKKTTNKTETSTKVTKQIRNIQMKNQTAAQQVITKKQNTINTSTSQNKQQSPKSLGKQRGSSPNTNLRQQSPNKPKTPTLRSVQSRKQTVFAGTKSQKDQFGNIKHESFEDGTPPLRYFYTKRDTITSPTIAHSKHLSTVVPVKSAECICPNDTNIFPQRDEVKKELVDSYMKLYDAQGCQPYNYYCENITKKPSEIMISINPGHEQLNLSVKKDEHKKEVTINRTKNLSFSEESGCVGRRQPCTTETCKNLRNAEANKYRDERSYFHQDANKHYTGDRCPINDPSERDKEIRHLLGVDLRRTDRMVQVDNKHKTQKDEEPKNYNRGTTFQCYFAKGEKCPMTTLQTNPRKNNHKQYDIKSFYATTVNQKTSSPYYSQNSSRVRSMIKNKTITLSRREFMKVKQSIQYTLDKRQTVRNWKSKRKSYSDISVNVIKNKTKQPKVINCDKGIQTDKRIKRGNSSKATTKHAGSDHKNIQTDLKTSERKHKLPNRDSTKENKHSFMDHKESKTVILFRANDLKRDRKEETQSTVRRKVSNNLNYRRHELESSHSGLARRVKSSLELRYASVAFMRKTTFSSLIVHGSRARTNLESNIGDSSRPQKPKSRSSILTLFKSTYHRKSVTPNLGTSAYSLYPEGGSIRSIAREKPDEKAKKPFLRRLVSCLVMRQKSNQKFTKKPSVVTTEAKSSWDSYHISSSFAGMEMTSSLYDTSVSFFSSHHGINPINSKIKRSFLGSVREMLTKKS